MAHWVLRVLRVFVVKWFLALLSPLLHGAALSRNQSKKPCVPARESGRKHRAWGVSPRLSSIVTQPAKWAKARITGYQIRNGCRPHPRADIFNAHDPGAHAPGFTLAPASQAGSYFVRKKGATSVPRNLAKKTRSWRIVSRRTQRMH